MVQVVMFLVSLRKWTYSVEGERLNLNKNKRFPMRDALFFSGYKRNSFVPPLTESAIVNRVNGDTIYIEFPSTDYQNSKIDWNDIIEVINESFKHQFD